ncbi:MAG TPA: cytochrome P450 [Candidatus Angelobacter sp.]|nr:cytochrome P450 [Candidatus Angelobacter sp.]
MHWDPFLHAWVVTRYADVVLVLQSLSAQCAPAPQRLESMGLSALDRIGQIMVLQHLFMDPPDHTRLRALCSQAFTPHRVERLRGTIQDIVNSLLEPHLADGQIELMADLANPLPAIVSARILGLPPSDHEQLKTWSADFAEVLGNFQHNPDRTPRMLRSLDETTAYFREAVHRERNRPAGDSMISVLVNAEIDGRRLDEEMIIANCILLMVGAQETTPNLIGNGMLALLRNRSEFKKLQSDVSLLPSAVEEMLRFEAPSQHTTRISRQDLMLGGKKISSGESVIAVMGAANRDPDRFPDPDRFDITRKDNKHLAFGAGPHYCFGAPLGRIEANLAFRTLMERISDFSVASDRLLWRDNLGLRGLVELPLFFSH